MAVEGCQWAMHRGKVHSSILPAVTAKDSSCIQISAHLGYTKLRQENELFKTITR